ncbi:MAG: VanZ family protein [Candidatus Blackburnbacteria bacterium]|nr:VanZ family protein [Candidatus Blackburnbacteria bacterium]
MKKFRNYWLPTILWALVIFFLSALTVTPSKEFYWQDFLVKKTAHLVEYAILFTFLYRALLNATTFSKKRAAFIALILCSLYGLTDEYHQSFTPGREPKGRDVIIDTIGAGLAWLYIWKYLPGAPERLRSLAKVLQII